MSPTPLERDGKTYIPVCASHEVRSSSGVQAELDEFTEVAVFRFEGACYALSNICPHQHHALMAKGMLENGTVICPMHGWQFNLKDGMEVSGLGRIKTYHTLELNGVVYVEFDTDEIPSWMRTTDE